MPGCPERYRDAGDHRADDRRRRVDRHDQAIRYGDGRDEGGLLQGARHPRPDQGRVGPLRLARAGRPPARPAQPLVAAVRGHTRATPHAAVASRWPPGATCRSAEKTIGTSLSPSPDAARSRWSISTLCDQVAEFDAGPAPGLPAEDSGMRMLLALSADGSSVTPIDEYGFRALPTANDKRWALGHDRRRQPRARDRVPRIRVIGNPLLQRIFVATRASAGRCPWTSHPQPGMAPR